MYYETTAIDALKSEWAIDDSAVAVWQLNTADFPDKAQYIQQLSELEKITTSKFRFQKDRDNFIMGRAVLRIITGNLLELDPEAVVFDYNKFGKPFLANNAWLNFNVSHSDTSVVIGFSKNAIIGIDVEQIKGGFEVLHLAANYFSEKEIEVLQSLPKHDQLKAFYRCWTRKESFIKAQGEGLSFPLHSFTVSMDTDITADLKETVWDTEEQENWRLFSFVPAAGYIGAVAVRKNTDKITLRNWR